MEQELKVGDVVVVRSGSYRMTIKSIVGTKAICSYYDSKMKLHEDEFELVLLSVPPKSRSGIYIRV